MSDRTQGQILINAPRERILDVIGDLRLAGIIRGHVIAVASGHALNTQLAKQIAAAFVHQ